MFSVLVVVLRPDHIAGLGFSSGQREIPLIASLRVLRALRLWAGGVRWPRLWAGSKWRCRSLLVSIHVRLSAILHGSLLRNGRWSAPRRTRSTEHQCWCMYATVCGRAAQQTNCSYSQWRKVPRGNAHDFLEL